MNLNLLNATILMDHRYIGLVISLVVIAVSVSAILFKYFVRHNKDKDNDKQ